MLNVAALKSALPILVTLRRHYHHCSCLAYCIYCMELPPFISNIASSKSPIQWRQVSSSSINSGSCTHVSWLHTEGSINGDTPSHHPFLDGISLTKTIQLWGYPHDYGHLHMVQEKERNHISWRSKVSLRIIAELIQRIWDDHLFRSASANLLGNTWGIHRGKQETIPV